MKKLTMHSKKIFVLLVVCFFIFCFAFIGVYSTLTISTTPMKKYTIVIDAGHGGIDGGVVGYSGNIYESDVNLQFALKLGKLFSGHDFNVVYTRQDSGGLYQENAKNKKADDMKKRISIIESCNADIVISLHQNGFVLPNQRGITAFYKSTQSASKDLACVLQERFQDKLNYARKEALVGDYYILNECSAVCVLIECGFLTNPEEEQLLIDEQYQQEVCFQIFTGTIKYLLTQNKLIDAING